MPEAVSLEFELTPEEWVSAQMAHCDAVYARRGELKALQNTTAALLAVLGLGGLFLGLWFPTAVLIGVGVALTGMIPSRIRKATRLQLEKTAAEGIIPGLFGHHRLELREEGLLNITEGYEHLTKWSAVEGVENTDGMFVIYTGAHSFLPIPQSAFRGSEELRAFSDAFHTLRGMSAERRREVQGSGGGDAPDPGPLLPAAPVASDPQP